MNSSDIIAIVAIVISAIVSIVSAYISYHNNKANIEARKNEMAFEKQLETFREITQSIGKTTFSFLDIDNINMEDQDSVNTFKNENEDFIQKMMDAYIEKRIFLPNHIYQKLHDFMIIFAEEGSKIYEEIDKEECDLSAIKESRKKVRRAEEEIVVLMQKYIGL